MSAEASNLFASRPERTCDFRLIPVKNIVQKSAFIETIQLRFKKRILYLKLESEFYLIHVK